MCCLVRKSPISFLFVPQSLPTLTTSALLILSLAISACASTDENKADPQVTARLTAELETVKKAHQEILADSKLTSEQLALLKTEVVSLKEQQATSRRQLEVVRRGARSGIYEDQSAGKAGEKAPHKPLVGIDVPAIKTPDAGIGRSAEGSPGELGHEESEIDTPSPSAAGAQAHQLVADAQLKMQRASYGEAVVVLAQLQKEIPNFEDNGLVSLLLAECWLKLAQPENALPVLRSFYLKHPQSPDLLKAKLLEGRVLEKSGAREKALVVYREVLALGPETAFAREARAALGRMRDAR